MSQSHPLVASQLGSWCHLLPFVNANTPINPQVGQIGWTDWTESRKGWVEQPQVLVRKLLLG
jgi:hypothetical protein